MGSSMSPLPENLLRQFLTDGPRDLPKKTYRAAAGSLLYFVAIFPLCMAIAMVIAFSLVWLFSPNRESLSLLLVLILALPLSAFAISFWALRKLRQKWVLVRCGKVMEAEVIAVSTMSGRINGQYFFRIKVVHEVDGEKRESFDYVNQFPIEYFLEARDSHKPVKVLCLPGIKNTVVILDKLAVAYRFD